MHCAILKEVKCSLSAKELAIVIELMWRPKNKSLGVLQMYKLKKVVDDTLPLRKIWPAHS